MRTTSRCSRRSVPPKGFRHLLKRRDLERFVELIPDWDELSTGLNWVVLSKHTDCHGYHRRGEIAVCAWPSALWTEDMTKSWYWEHAELLERLGVDVWKVGYRWVATWTEDQVRAYQLLHVFLHELGHHVDRTTTWSRRRPARGERSPRRSHSSSRSSCGRTSLVSSRCRRRAAAELTRRRRRVRVWRNLADAPVSETGS